MSRKQGPRSAGMRPSARAEGPLRSNGEPTGLLLAGAAAGRIGLLQGSTNNSLMHNLQEADHGN